MPIQPLSHNKRIYEQILLPKDFPIIINDLYGNAIISKHTNVSNTETSYSLHAHDCLEIGYCKANPGIFIINDKIVPYKQESVSIFPKNTFHILPPNKRDDWIFVSLDPKKLLDINFDNDFSFIEQAYTDSTFIFDIESYPEICGIVKKVIIELDNKEMQYKKLIRNLISELLIMLGRIYYNSESSFVSVDSNLFFKLNIAIKYIAQKYSYTLSIPYLAKLCNLSETHFRRLFRINFSMSPLEYITKYRINMAKLLLANNNYPIISIALDVGFSSISSFNKQFKKSTGVSPREWRSKNTN